MVCDGSPARAKKKKKKKWPERARTHGPGSGCHGRSRESETRFFLTRGRRTHNGSSSPKHRRSPHDVAASARPPGENKKWRGCTQSDGGDRGTGGRPFLDAKVSPARRPPNRRTEQALRRLIEGVRHRSADNAQMSPALADANAQACCRTCRVAVTRLGAVNSIEFRVAWPTNGWDVIRRCEQEKGHDAVAHPRRRPRQERTGALVR
jgi:hypothetical protein